MSPTEAANKVKSLLMEVVDAMNEAASLGVKIEFNIGTDAMTNRNSLANFRAWQQMKTDS